MTTEALMLLPMRLPLRLLPMKMCSNSVAGGWPTAQ
jgi:hypothetical protein